MGALALAAWCKQPEQTGGPGVLVGTVARIDTAAVTHDDVTRGLRDRAQVAQLLGEVTYGIHPGTHFGCR